MLEFFSRKSKANNKKTRQDGLFHPLVSLFLCITGFSDKIKRYSVDLYYPLSTFVVEGKGIDSSTLRRLCQELDQLTKSKNLSKSYINGED